MPETPAFACLRIDVLVMTADGVEASPLLADESPLIRIRADLGNILIVADVDQVLPPDRAVGGGLDDVVHDVVVDVQRPLSLAACKRRQLIAALNAAA